MSRNQSILAVLGPTASGKTALSVRLAKHFGGEVVCCDSMQIYKELLIGTARATEEEMAGVPHHLLGFCDPRTPFSCADYVSLARQTVEEMEDRGALPVFCGGTGLYFDSFLRGTEAYEGTAGDPEIRAALTRRAEEEGIDGIYEELAKADAVSAAQIHKNNTRRVIRALEIYLATGKPKSVWDAESKETSSPYRSLPLAIDFHDRSILHDRIGRRVDRMLQAGLWDEVSSLYERGLLPDGSTAAQAIGYKEIIAAIRTGASVEAAREAIIVGTRQYAKRQLTWFRRTPGIRFLYADDYSDEEAMARAASELVTAFLEEE